MVNWTWNNENENQAHKLILIIWLNGNDLAAGMLENVYHSWKCVRVPRVAHFQSRLIVSITIIVIRELMTTQHNTLTLSLQLVHGMRTRNFYAFGISIGTSGETCYNVMRRSITNFYSSEWTENCKLNCVWKQFHCKR